MMVDIYLKLLNDLNKNVRISSFKQIGSFIFILKLNTPLSILNQYMKVNSKEKLFFLPDEEVDIYYFKMLV